MRHRGILSLAGALLAIAFLGLACVDTPGGGTSGGTVLYAYDNSAQQLIEWDASTFYDSDSPTTLKIVSSTVFTNKMGNLSWGGLCLDSSNNQLYLVNETTGVVVRVNNIRGKSGAIASNSPDVVTFTLGSSSDRLASGKFGQAAIDSATRTLFVTEKNDSGDTRIWVVSSAANQLQDSVVAVSNSITVAGDTACSGVAAGLGGQVFAYFNSGNAIGIDAINGPRLRKGTSGGFSPGTSVLVGWISKTSQPRSRSWLANSAAVPATSMPRCGLPVLSRAVKMKAGMSGLPDYQVATAARTSSMVVSPDSVLFSASSISSGKPRRFISVISAISWAPSAIIVDHDSSKARNSKRAIRPMYPRPPQ